MPVERIDRARAATFTIDVANNDHVPPALMTIPRKDDNAVTDHINRVAEVRIAAARSIPVFSHMSVRAKSTRLVITAGFTFTDRKIKSVRDFGKRALRRKVDRRRQWRLVLSRGL